MKKSLLDEFSKYQVSPVKLEHISSIMGGSSTQETCCTQCECTSDDHTVGDEDFCDSVGGCIDLFEDCGNRRGGGAIT